MTKISFYDHGRQSYADAVPPQKAGEIMVGDYDQDAGVGSLGEFKILFHDFHGDGGLAPQLQVFGDAVGALRMFLAVGGAEVMASHVGSVDEFSRKLIAIGLTDCSDMPLAEVAA